MTDPSSALHIYFTPGSDDLHIRTLQPHSGSSRLIISCAKEAISASGAGASKPPGTITVFDGKALTQVTIDIPSVIATFQAMGYTEKRIREAISADCLQELVIESMATQIEKELEIPFSEESHHFLSGWLKILIEDQDTLAEYVRHGEEFSRVDGGFTFYLNKEGLFLQYEDRLLNLYTLRCVGVEKPLSTTIDTTALVARKALSFRHDEKRPPPVVKTVSAPSMRPSSTTTDDSFFSSIQAIRNPTDAPIEPVAIEEEKVHEVAITHIRHYAPSLNADEVEKMMQEGKKRAALGEFGHFTAKASGLARSIEVTPKGQVIVYLTRHRTQDDRIISDGRFKVVKAAVNLSTGELYAVFNYRPRRIEDRHADFYERFNAELGNMVDLSKVRGFVKLLMTDIAAPKSREEAPSHRCRMVFYDKTMRDFHFDPHFKWLCHSSVARSNKDSFDRIQNIRKTIFDECLLALAHIHRLGKLHRDIKPENLLIKGKSIEDLVLHNAVPEIALADLGFVILQKEASGARFAGTYEYASPQFFRLMRIDQFLTDDKRQLARITEEQKALKDRLDTTTDKEERKKLEAALTKKANEGELLTKEIEIKTDHLKENALQAFLHSDGWAIAVVLTYTLFRDELPNTTHFIASLHRTDLAPAEVIDKVLSLLRIRALDDPPKEGTPAYYIWRLLITDPKDKDYITVEEVAAKLSEIDWS